MTAPTHPHRGYLSTPALGADYDAAPVAEDVEWQGQGLCRSGQHDPDLWYPDGRDSEMRSGAPISVCQHCPVLRQCRTWALSSHEVYGVWGGLSEDDRAAIWAGKIPKRRYLRPPPRKRGAPRRKLPAA